MRVFGLVAVSVLLLPAWACAQHPSGTRSAAGPRIHGSPSPSSGSHPSGMSSPQSRQPSNSAFSRPLTSNTATRSFGSTSAGRWSVVDIWNWLSRSRPVKAPQGAVWDAVAHRHVEAAGEVGRTVETKIFGSDGTENEKFLSTLLRSARKSADEKNPDLLDQGIAAHRMGCDKAPCPDTQPHPASVKICNAGHCPIPVCLTSHGPCRFQSVHIACSAGQVRYGGICSGASPWASNAPLCGGFESRAAVLAAESRNNQAEIAQVCRTDPNGEECSRLTQRQNALLLEYQGLLAQTPSACRTLMPTYISLM